MKTSDEVAEEISCLKNETVVKKESLFKRICRNVTLEPLWFGISSSMMIGIIAFKNFYLLRACKVDLGYPEELCLGSSHPNHSHIESESQALVASINVGCGFIGGMFTMVVVLFLGPWSDASGKRRPLILFPLAMYLVGSFNMLVMQMFPMLSVKWVIYLHAIPIAMGGQYSLLSIAAFSYLGDICVKEGRCTATVIGSNNGFFAFFMLFGTIMGPIIYRVLGFTYLFIICFLLECTSFIYAYYKVNDVNNPEEVIPKVYDLKLPFRALQCVLKKRQGKRRMMVILIILITCCNTMLYENDNTITYMYLRKEFLWTEVEYGILLTIKSIIFVIGTLFIVTILKRKMKMKDQNIGMVGGLSLLASYVAFMTCTKTIHIYLVRILSLFGSGIAIAERPTLLKQIKANEQGKIACITSIIDNCVAFMVNPLSNYVYLVTMDWFPIGYNLIGVFALMIQVLCYGLIIDHKDTEEEQEIKEENIKI